MDLQNQKIGTTQKQLLFKISFILVLMLLLLLPISWIQGLISERETLQATVKEDITSSWGREQTLTGPVLCIPYTVPNTGGVKGVVEHVLFYTPEQLDITTKAATELRTKGIFSTVVYTSTNRIEGTFDLSNLPTGNGIAYQLEKATLITGLSDPTSISEGVKIQWDGAAQRANIGVKYSTFVQNGFHSIVPVQQGQKNYPFSITFGMRGASGLNFVPSGKNTTVAMTSDWNSPSFTGKQLPNTREISDAGFTANWSTSEFNRPFADYWSDQEVTYAHIQTSFGVNLLQTANYYQQNMRTAKYAFLVIGLSFLVFFFYEVMMRIRIHPIQYIMIGLSLVIFYSLLLSITEHAGFGTAYLISGLSVVTLIAFYTYSIVKKAKPVVMLVGLFTMLYVYIYIILQLEDFALLAGSAGLFFILALIMSISRKIDWYQMSISSIKEDGPETA
jgi:inner membrane protein